MQWINILDESPKDGDTVLVNQGDEYFVAAFSEVGYIWVVTRCEDFEVVSPTDRWGKIDG